jgi:dihydrofolate synthase/folylpolyglutamate synthase
VPRGGSFCTGNCKEEAGKLHCGTPEEAFFVNYSEAEKWLFSRRRMGMKYGLDRMLSMMADLGNPEKQFRTVHIVGTNGKGSTAAVLSGLAGELGISCGRGTSPHLLDYRERIAVNNNWIPQDTVARFITDYRHTIRKHSATFFEITTAMAAWHFAAEGVEWVVAEAGLGGRLDATRSYDGVGTVFTGVRIEHSRILGNTQEKIAAEKIAIASRETVLVAASQTPGVEEVIAAAVENKKLRRVFPVGVNESPLPGAHQFENSALAVTAAQELMGRAEEEVRSAFCRVCSSLRWPGRLDYRQGIPSILFDVAHNPQSMKALVKYMKPWGNSVPMVVGFLNDKPWHHMVELLKTVVGTVVVTTPDSERKLDAASLGRYMRNQGFTVKVRDRIEDAVALCRRIAGSRPMVVTGSFHVVGRAINESVDRGWVNGLPNSAGDVLG